MNIESNTESEESNNYTFGSREKVIQSVLKLEEEVRFIPIHRETRKTMESWSDEYLARYRWQLLELRTRGSGQL